MKKFVVVLVVQLIVVYASLYSQALLNNVRSYNGNMGASDLYVALSRGAKSVTVFSVRDEFTP